MASRGDSSFQSRIRYLGQSSWHFAKKRIKDQSSQRSTIRFKETIPVISLFSMTIAYETEQFVRNQAAKGMGISEVTDIQV